MTRDEFIECAERRGGGEITMDINPGAFDIITKVRQFFEIYDVPFCAYPGGKCHACEGGVLISYDDLEEVVKQVEASIEGEKQRSGLWQMFDRRSVYWYAIAHEASHHLQATNHTWLEMESDPQPFEAGADYLAGVCMGWYTVDADINFLNAIDSAWEIGMEPIKATTHPTNEQRKIAVSAGASQGAKAWHYTDGGKGTIKLPELLTVSEEVASKILNGV